MQYHSPFAVPQTRLHALPQLHLQQRPVFEQQQGALRQVALPAAVRGGRRGAHHAQPLQLEAAAGS